MGVSPVEEFGIESFFGCNGVLFGDWAVEVGGFVALEGWSGGSGSGRHRKLPLLDLLRGRSYKYIDSGSWSFAGGRAEQRGVE
eukprot:scaffold3200_cov106-Skeletonema_marinoi.AAC.3